MSKKPGPKPNKPKYPTTIAAARRQESMPPPPLAPWLTVGLAVRAVLGVLIVLLAITASKYTLRVVEARALAGYGSARAKDPNGLLIARGELKRAYDIYPYDPDITAELADTIMGYENNFGAKGELQNINFNALWEAFELLKSVHPTYLRPSRLNRKIAEMAQLMAVNAGRVGRPDVKERFNAQATANFLELRYIQGFPLSQQDAFYNRAVRALANNGKPHFALLFFEDWRHYQGERASIDREAMGDVQTSRLQLGETHFYFAQLANDIRKDPSNLQNYEDLAKYTSMFGERKYPIFILQEADHRGNLPQPAKQLLQQLTNS